MFTGWISNCNGWCLGECGTGIDSLHLPVDDQCVWVSHSNMNTHTLTWQSNTQRDIGTPETGSSKPFIQKFLISFSVDFYLCKVKLWNLYFYCNWTGKVKQCSDYTCCNSHVCLYKACKDPKSSLLLRHREKGERSKTSWGQLKLKPDAGRF